MLRQPTTGKIVAISACAIIGMALLGATATDRDLTKETEAQKSLRMKWWREARFGMFIHWGFYAVPGGVHHGEIASRNMGSVHGFYEEVDRIHTINGGKRTISVTARPIILP